MVGNPAVSVTFESKLCDGYFSRYLASGSKVYEALVEACWREHIVGPMRHHVDQARHGDERMSPDVSEVRDYLLNKPWIFMPNDRWGNMRKNVEHLGRFWCASSLVYEDRSGLFGENCQWVTADMASFLVSCAGLRTLRERYHNHKELLWFFQEWGVMPEIGWDVYLEVLRAVDRQVSLQEPDYAPAMHLKARLLKPLLSTSETTTPKTHLKHPFQLLFTLKAPLKLPFIELQAPPSISSHLVKCLHCPPLSLSLSHSVSLSIARSLSRRCFCCLSLSISLSPPFLVLISMLKLSPYICFSQPQLEVHVVPLVFVGLHWRIRCQRVPRRAKITIRRRGREIHR